MVAQSGSPRRCRRASKGGWPMSSEAPIALLFGAGKVARGFLGHLLSRSGYSLWFVDKNAELVERLDAAGRYPLLVLPQSGAGAQSVMVEGVRGLHSSDTDSVADLFARADLVLTAV